MQELSCLALPPAVAVNMQDCKINPALQNRPIPFVVNFVPHGKKNHSSFWHIHISKP